MIWELKVSEIVVGTRFVDGMTAELNSKLIKLLEGGMHIRAFTQLYEELTYRIPVQHVERDFYSYFPFSRSNRNKFYLLFSRVLELVLSVIGLAMGLVVFPFILIGNLIGNRGPLFYHQTRVGKNGKHFRLYKLRVSAVRQCDQRRNESYWSSSRTARVCVRFN